MLFSKEKELPIVDMDDEIENSAVELKNDEAVDEDEYEFLHYPHFDVF